MFSGKSILAKLLEKGVRILLIKECKKIGHLKINIISTSYQILKGEIQKISIIARGINYKDLFFDKVELEGTQIEINYKRKEKELKFKKNPIIKFKISFSETSLKNILISNDWHDIGNFISKEILNHEKLKDLKIRNDQFSLEAFEGDTPKQINIKAENGNVYLVNKQNNKIVRIPIENKIHIKTVKIENNFINISGNSPISF